MTTEIQQDTEEKLLASIGTDEASIVCAPREIEDAIDQGLGMKLISIRLPTSLIEELKIIAEYKQQAYQPLVREVLRHYADAQLKQIGLELYRARNALIQD